MRRIAIAAAKGGTGKTTTAVHLAHALALAGERVLLVDCDPRRHAALSFGLEPSPGLAEWLDGSRVHAVGVRTGLRILQSGGAALAHAATTPGFAMRLRTALDAVHDADFVVLDAPPDSGPLHDAVLAAAHEVLVPVAPDWFALQAAAALRDALAAAPQGLGPRFLGILPTLDEPGLPSTERLARLRQAAFPGQVLETSIRRCEAVRLAPCAAGTVFDTEPMAQGAYDYARLAAEIAPTRG